MPARTGRSKDLRPVITLVSTAGTGCTYVTRKNRRNTPDRLVLRKFDWAPRTLTRPRVSISPR